jgi:hypothetical protein
MTVCHFPSSPSPFPFPLLPFDANIHAVAFVEPGSDGCCELLQDRPEQLCHLWLELHLALRASSPHAYLLRASPLVPFAFFL